MRIGTSKQFCKKEQKKTDFAVYILENGKMITKCISCSRTYKVQKYNSDNDYRKRNLEYSIKWNKNNPGKVAHNRLRATSRKFNEKDKEFLLYNKFYTMNTEEINLMLKHYQYYITALNLVKLMVKNKTNTLKGIKNLIIRKKRTELLKKYTGEESILAKSRFKVLKIYSTLHEDRKIQIREEYKRLTRERVERVMNELN